MVDWVIANWSELGKAILMVIGGASIIVRITPTLKEDHFFKPLIKFVGKWIAQDRYGPSGSNSKSTGGGSPIMASLHPNKAGSVQPPAGQTEKKSN